jgi:hypothetical protein
LRARPRQWLTPAGETQRSPLRKFVAGALTGMTSTICTCVSPPRAPCCARTAHDARRRAALFQGCLLCFPLRARPLTRRPPAACLRRYPIDVARARMAVAPKGVANNIMAVFLDMVRCACDALALRAARTCARCGRARVCACAL